MESETISLDKLMKRRLRPISWYKRLYWKIGRLPTPRTVWYSLQAFWQRGRRGWADYDSWNASFYLADIIPGLVKQLRERGIGYTCVHDPEDLAEHDPVCSAEDWEEVLKRIEFGFRYYVFVEENNWKINSSEEIRRRGQVQLEVLDEALRLFSKYYVGLWD